VTLQFLVFLGVGKLLIYLIQIFPFLKIPIISWFFETEEGFLVSLVKCDLCLGCWVYSILDVFWFHQDLLNGWGIIHINIISEIVTGLIASFVVHIVSIGWKDKFGVFYANG